MGLEVREWDQLVHVLVVATVMLALLAIGLASTDLARHFERTAVTAPPPEARAAATSREGLFRALVSDLRRAPQERVLK